MAYIPEQGDIVFLEFDPQAGHEQKGKRPALVISSNLYNNFTGLAIVCPITNTNKGFPLHIELGEKTNTSGVIMCEQAKALDLQARNATFYEKATKEVIEEVIDLVISFFELKK